MSAPGSTPTALVDARDIHVRLNGREIVAGVDLGVREGDIVTLIGPNGAGKTTLIRAILGLLSPSAGTVTRQPGLRVGYMPQRLAIDPTLPLPVDRFLAYSAPAGVDDRRTVLDEVGAHYLWDTALADVSGGEFQRVLLARALLREPDLLVLDEPAQAIDVTGQAELYQTIDAIRIRRRCGVLLVSHDLHLVMSTADHVVCINTHLCCAGTPDAVSRDAGYLALFGEHVAASFAHYRHRHDHRHHLDGSVVAEGAQGDRHHG